MSWSGRRSSRKSITGALGGQLVDEDAHLTERVDDRAHRATDRVSRAGGRGEQVVDDEPDDEQTQRPSSTPFTLYPRMRVCDGDHEARRASGRPRGARPACLRRRTGRIGRPGRRPRGSRARVPVTSPIRRRSEPRARPRSRDARGPDAVCSSSPPAEVLAMPLDLRDDLVDALPRGRDGEDDRRLPVGLARRHHGADLAPGGVRAVAIGLVDDEDVADLEDAGLEAWMPSPMPGASRTSVVSARPAISTSDCPTPTVSTRITSHPAASSTRSACGAAPARPPEMAAAGHRPDVDALVGGVVLHAHPVTEQGAAGERRRRVDGEHPDPLVLRPQGGDERRGRRRLAHAGRPGDADDVRLPGVRGERGAHLAQRR